MSIIRIIVTATLLLIAIANVALADETNNTETNTNIRSSFFGKYFAPQTALAAEGVVQQNQAQEAEKTPEELANETILAKWKAKQADKWGNLPQGTFTINASAYTASADECGNSKGITASGIRVHKGTIACPPQFPFGVKIKIDGYGTFVCEDRGGAIKGNKIDIYVPTKSEAFQFGRRNLVAEVVL